MRRAPLAALVISLLTVMLAPAAPAATLAVAPDGSGQYPTILAAVDAAQDGDEIVLADGVFTGQGNRQVVVNNLSVTVRSASGDPTACVVDVDGSPDEQLYAFMATGQSPHTLTIEGIGFRNAWLPSTRDGRAGGAIGANDAAQLLIRHCRFEDNEAGYGGAIGASGGPHQIEDCVFEGNTGHREGGALYFYESNATITGSVFARNEGTNGGAIFAIGGHVEVNGSTFVLNTDGGESGVISARNGATVLVERSLVAFNSALAVFCYNADLDVACSDFYGNRGPAFPDCASDDEGLLGNFSADPRLCSVATGDYHLAADSPCAPTQSGDCELIGALPVGCAEPSLEILVLADGSGDLPTIQAALDLATPMVDIVLGDGVFTGPGNRDLDFHGRDLRLVSQSGDPASCVIDAEGEARLATLDGADATIESITLRGGLATTGGGLLITGGSPTILGCVIEDCEATDTGGGVSITEASPRLEGCVLRNNQAANRGGAVFSLLAEPVFDRATLVSNAVGNLAGGVVWSNHSTITISNSIIAFSGAGEAVHWNEGEVPRLTCCDLYGNAGGDWTGAISDQLGQDGNLSADPLFCNLATGSLRIDVASPCAPDQSGACGLIGALGVGCTDVAAVAITPAEPAPIACDQTLTVGVAFAPAATGTAVRSYHVRLTVPAPLAFGADDIVVHTLPAGAEATHFLVENGPGDWSIDYTILGADTPGIVHGAELFTVTMHAVEDGDALVELAEVQLRDLANHPVPLSPQAPALVPVMCGPTGPVDMAEARPRHEGIDLAWQDPAHPYLAELEVYRGRFDDAEGNSAYPRYGQLDGASAPARPVTRDQAKDDPRWTLVATLQPGDQAYHDPLPTRGLYHYEVFPLNGASVAGPPSALPLAATSYLLGDCAPDHDGQVDVLDLNVFGDAYATSDGHPAFDAEADFGPTDDMSGAGVPIPDGAVDFEDLVIMGLNFGLPGAAAATDDTDPATTSPLIRLAWSDLPDGRHALELVSGEGLKSLRLRSAAVAAPAVNPGALARAQDGPVFLRNAGGRLDLACALLGAGRIFEGVGDLLILDGGIPADLQIDARGRDGRSLTCLLDGVVTAVELPSAVALAPCFPNPFNPATTIRFALPRGAAVRLGIYGLDGRLVATLVDGHRTAGVHEIVWRGTDGAGRGVASGTYFCRLQADGITEVRKMVLTR